MTFLWNLTGLLIVYLLLFGKCPPQYSQDFGDRPLVA